MMCITGRVAMRSRTALPALLLSFGLLISTSLYAQEDEVTPEVQRLYAEAQAAQKQGDDAGAIAKYRAMLRLAPHLAAAYNNLGRLYFNQHDYSHAADTLAAGLKLNPQMPTASAMLGMSYFELGEVDKAEAPLQTALEANPQDPLVQVAMAKVLIRERKYDEAVALLKTHTTQNPRDQEAWYLLGNTYLQLSEESLTKINEIDPNSVVAHEVTGEIDESMKNYDGALAEYKKAVDLAPERSSPHIHMANAYWALSKWDSAKTEFEAGLAHDPNNCTARWKLGNTILEENGPATDALAQLNQAITLCPRLMQARVERARALVKLNRQSEALPDLELAKKESPREPSIHFLLASVYRAEGKTAQAQEEMRIYGRLQREASEGVAAQANESIDLKSAAH